MYRTITVIILTLPVVACSPLRKTQRERHEMLEISDTMLTRLVRTELERTFTELHQTVVEFYPPSAEPLPAEEELPDSLITLPPPKIPAVRQPAIRRIVRTEVVNLNDRLTAEDSLSHSRINAAARCDEQSSTDEQRNTAAGSWIKWCAACLLLTLIIILIFKLS